MLRALVCPCLAAGHKFVASMENPEMVHCGLLDLRAAVSRSYLAQFTFNADACLRLVSSTQTWQDDALSTGAEFIGERHDIRSWPLTDWMELTRDCSCG